VSDGPWRPVGQKSDLHVKGCFPNALLNAASTPFGNTDPAWTSVVLLYGRYRRWKSPLGWDSSLVLSVRDVDEGVCNVDGPPIGQAAQLSHKSAQYKSLCHQAPATKHTKPASCGLFCVYGEGGCGVSAEGRQISLKSGFTRTGDKADVNRCAGKMCNVWRLQNEIARRCSGCVARVPARVSRPRAAADRGDLLLGARRDRSRDSS
jgi:hypothetical protein